MVSDTFTNNKSYPVGYIIMKYDQHRTLFKLQEFETQFNCNNVMFISVTNTSTLCLLNGLLLNRNLRLFKNAFSSIDVGGQSTQQLLMIKVILLNFKFFTLTRVLIKPNIYCNLIKVLSYLGYYRCDYVAIFSVEMMMRTKSRSEQWSRI